jgi:hypothetical protein
MRKIAQGRSTSGIGLLTGKTLALHSPAACVIAGEFKPHGTPKSGTFLPCCTPGTARAFARARRTVGDVDGRAGKSQRKKKSHSVS